MIFFANWTSKKTLDNNAFKNKKSCDQLWMMQWWRHDNLFLWGKICKLHVITACAVMFTARLCPLGTLFYTFVPRKLPIFSFIINKFIISNFVLHNPVHKWTHKCGFLDEMTCPADMGERRTSLYNQYLINVRGLDYFFNVCIDAKGIHWIHIFWNCSVFYLSDNLGKDHLTVKIALVPICPRP